MPLDQLIGWLGSALHISGSVALARSSIIWCILLNAGGNIAYVVQSLMLHNWSLLFLEAVLLGLAIAAFRAWKKRLGTTRHR